jgi:hypothetical protein
MNMVPYQGKDYPGLGNNVRYGLIPEGFRNDGEFDYIPYLVRRMITFRFRQLKKMTDTVSNGYGFILMYPRPAPHPRASANSLATEGFSQSISI